MKEVKIILKFFLSFLVNNMLLNNFFILTGLEKKMKKFTHPYLHFRIDTTKNLQETAGFSNRPEINEVLEKCHSDLQKVARKFFPDGGRVLDVGCGPGLYLKDFDKRYLLHGSDISEGMLKLAQRELPYAKFYPGDFMKIQFEEKLHLIYCIGVLIYISRTELDDFFRKAHDLLEPGGIFFLHYPHAIHWCDLFYPDLRYIQYSPALIQQTASKKFNILEHHHGFDGRVIHKYDEHPYKSTNPLTNKTYKNSYLLIAKRAQ